MSTDHRLIRLAGLLTRESPLTLAREAYWRATKRWRQSRFQARLLKAPETAVRFRPVGYYRIPSRCEFTADMVQNIVDYAETICRGEFPWFGYGPVRLGSPPRWNFDFVSGQEWPRAESRSLIVIRKDGSDVKVPWDLSRLQFLPVLGKAWRLTDRHEYLEQGKALLTDWIDENPVGTGVNWLIAMEVALRAISICLFLELAWPAVQEDASWWKKINLSLWQHLLFVEANNEFSYLTRSNHYLSNVVGLFCLASWLQAPGVEHRRALYGNLVQRESEGQVYGDGGSFEASTGYHAFATQLFTTAYRLMLAQGTLPAPEFSVTLCRMFTFLGALTDERGRAPHIGDCDDGRVELLSGDLTQMLLTNAEDRHSLCISGLLGIGSELFRRNFHGNREDTPWNAAPALETELPLVEESIASFPQTGIALARRGDTEIVFLAQPNGIHGKGSHTHNDKLSILIRLQGHDFLVDAGTGCYSRDCEVRNRFRATASHNTLLVDGQEQNRFSQSSGGLFRMRDDARVSPIERSDVDGVLVKASHDGYRRLGVMHQRAVQLRPDGSVTIEDSLRGHGEHSFQAFFRLPGKWTITPITENGRYVSCVAKGPCRVHLSWESGTELSLSCEPGQVSRAYGSVVEARVISLSATTAFPATLITRISREL